MSAVTAERLRELLHYDPLTGVFCWRVDRRSGKPATRMLARAGDVAGSFHSSGGYSFIAIGVDGRDYKAHRLAWLYVTGMLPINTIDHINGVPSDNRFCNLREASQAQNLCNRRGWSEHGKGVSWDRFRGKYRAAIQIGGKQKYLGRFPTAAEASAAYQVAAIQHHGEFARF